MWTAAILAGGRASRLGGRDKGNLRIGGRTILERQLAVLAPLTPQILLVTSRVSAAVPAGVTVVTDRVRGAGALAGLEAALSASTSALTLVVAGDLPFLRAPLLVHLVARAGDVDAVIPRTADGYQPLCAVYGRGALVAVRRRLDAGSFKLVDLLADLRVREIGPADIASLDPDGTMFLNVNTPEDYARALAVPKRP